MGANPYMNRNNPWNSYRQVATQTASPGQLVLMLFDGAVRFLEQAMLGFPVEDPLERIQTINNNILRAQDIINELNYSLDLRQGGHLAETLRGLYEYFDRRLTESNVRKTSEGIEEVLVHIRTLRDAWNSMLTQASQTRVAQTAELCAVG